MHRIAIVAFAILLAGCTTPPATDETPDTPRESTATSTEPPQVFVQGEAAVQAPPTSMALSDCEGFQTGSYWLGVKPPTTNPSEWATGSPGARVILEGWTCNRISIGPYERGPVHLLLEYTDAIAPPDNCTKPSSVSYSLLSIGIDDANLTAYLASLAVPAYQFNATVADESLGPLKTHEWNWGPDNATKSTIRVLDDGNQVTAARPVFRFFWETLQGVAAMDWTYTGTEPTIGERVAIGVLSPPMLAARNQPMYAALGAWFQETSVDGALQYWSDQQCA